MSSSQSAPPQQETTTGPPRSDQPDPPRQWPCVIAWFTAPFLPAATARRTYRAGMTAAFLVHVVGILMCYIVEELQHSSSWRLIRPLHWIYEGLAGTSTSLGQTILSVIGTAVVCEVTFVLLAAVLMGWGATVEPLRKSYAHALRRLWLQTSHVALVFACANISADQMAQSSRYWSSHVSRLAGPYPRLPRGEARDAKAIKRFHEELAEWHVRYSELVNAHFPWYMQNQKQLVTSSRNILYLWFLVSLLRALGARRPARPTPRGGPLCQACGYNLTGMGLDARCPECGEPVADSVGPNVRPGTILERPRGERGRASMVRTFWHATLRPRRFGREMRLVPGKSSSHRWYLALCFVPLFLAGLGANLLCRRIHYLAGGVPTPKRLWYWDPFLDAEVGLFVVVLFLLILVGTASAFGVFYRLWSRRNLLTGTMQAAAYQAGILVSCGIIGLASLVITIAVTKQGSSIHIWVFENLHANAPGSFYLWRILLAGMLLLYFRHVRQTCRGVQYA